jgi:hypothetical protein
LNSSILAEEEETIMQLTILLLLIGVSCSFKPEDKSSSQRSKEALSSIQAAYDSDGDWLSDSEEEANGGNRYIADIPLFTGELFQEMTVTTHFYNSTINKTESASFHAKKSRLGESDRNDSEDSFITNETNFLNEKAAMLAKRKSFHGFHLMENIQSNMGDLIAPPRISSFNAIHFSEQINRLKMSHRYEEIDFSIVSRLNISSGRFDSYSDVVVDLMIYDQMTKSFRVIDSQFINQTFKFNKNYQVKLQFKSNDKGITASVSESGARSVYLRVRDYKINDINKFYKHLLESVKSKSIPLYYNEGSDSRLYYIGINGSRVNLRKVLDTALNGRKITVENETIVSIGEKANHSSLEVDAWGVPQDEQKKWFLFTNEISNNPFNYSFGTNDFISISYFSKNSPSNIAPSYYSGVLTTKSPRTLKVFKIASQNLQDLRIHIKPKLYRGPRISTNMSQNCTNNPHEKICFKYSYENVHLVGEKALPAINLVNIKINNSSFKLDDLIKNGDAVIRMVTTGIFEVRLSKKFASTFMQMSTLTISVNSTKSSITGCSGNKVCESIYDECANAFRSAPECSITSSSNSSFILHDFTIKKNIEIEGELFISFDYI